MLLIASFTELKDQESNPSVVCRCCSNRVNFLHFHLLQNHWTNFNQTCTKHSITWVILIGSHLLQGEMKVTEYIDDF